MKKLKDKTNGTNLMKSKTAKLSVVNVTLPRKCLDCEFHNYGQCKLTNQQGCRKSKNACESFIPKRTPAPTSTKVTQTPKHCCSQCHHWTFGQCLHYCTNGHKPTKPACEAFSIREDAIEKNSISEKQSPNTKGQKNDGR